MYNILVGIQYLSVLLLLLEAGYIFSKWKTAIHGYLFFSCVATLVNNTGYLMEMLSRTKEEYLYATQMSYLGRVWISYALFLFILTLCKCKFPGKILVGLGVFHGVIFCLVLTAQWQPLYYSSMEYVEEGLFPYLKFGHGIFHTLYSLVVIFYIVFGITILVRTIGRESNPRRKKRLLLILASVIAQSFFYLLSMTRVMGNYDPNTLGYTISSLLMFYAMFRFRLLDTLTLAKDYVIDEVSEGIIAVDYDDSIEYYNRPALGIFPDIVRNQEETLKILRTALEQDVPLELGGKIYAVEEKVLYDGDVQQGKVYVLIDETEHYSYMKELMEQKQIAEDANASKSAFLSIVSHEIRTPMNAVVGMTELLLRDVLTDKQRKYLTNIKNSGSALTMIINDILDQSKIEAGKMEIVDSVYELRPMIDDVIMIIENRIGSKPIHLMTSIDEKIPEQMVGDSLRIRQIIINLMNNAVKFTESGYIQLSVRLEEETEAAYRIRFGVKDSGQGIKEEDLIKLGEAFTQVNTEKNHGKEGTGLGLSISKNFIALMGGELKVESIYGKGSEFFFTIEQKKAEELSEAGNKCANAWKTKAFTAKGATVLIVDDTEINLLIMQELLSPYKMAVDTANSGRKAIEMISVKKYDVIFMDYMMPGMDGVETTDKIRKMTAKETQSGNTEYFKTVPIIALTGDTSDRTMEMFKMAGIDDFTEKPVDPERIKKQLIKWLPEEMIQYE